MKYLFCFTIFCLFPISSYALEIPDNIRFNQFKNSETIDFSLTNSELISSSISVTSDSPETIVIKEFQFIGNTAFSDQELAEFLKPYTNKEITFAELLEAERKITNLYLDNGYINSGVVINAGQTFNSQEAIISINFIEGSVVEIDIQGLRRINSNYVKSRLKNATSKPFNVNDLYESLQLLQLNPLIQNISAELVSGIQPEEAILLVEVIEADSFSVTPIFNNGRSSNVGSVRRGVRIAENNLFGFGDAIDIAYINTDGSNAVNGSYSIPVNSYNGKIKFAAGFNDTKLVQPPFEVLDITGFSEFYEISFSQPVIQKPTHEFALGLALSIESSRSYLQGEPFPLSIGADINGNTDVTKLSFFQDWTIRQPQQFFNLRSEFNFGLDAFDSTINENLPDSRFFTWRSQAQYVRQLAPDSLFILQTDLQLSNDNLVNLEQFYLGGLNSVRGYPQDFKVTDNGFILSTEVWLPVLRIENFIKETDGVLQIIPFFDFGIGWNLGSVPNPDDNILAGIGLGLQWQMGNNFTARVDYGIPLTEVNIQKNSLNDHGFYFNINTKF